MTETSQTIETGDVQEDVSPEELPGEGDRCYSPDTPDEPDPEPDSDENDEIEGVAV